MQAHDRSRDHCVAILGVGLAFAKGQTGDSVSWIGATLAIESRRHLAITIVQARLDELGQLIKELIAKNVITLRALRSFTGKCQSMASVLRI